MSNVPQLLSIEELVTIVLARSIELNIELPKFTVETVTEWCNKELVNEVWTTHENPLQGNLLTLRGCTLVAMTLPPALMEDVNLALIVRMKGWTWVTRSHARKETGFFALGQAVAEFFDKDGKPKEGAFMPPGLDIAKMFEEAKENIVQLEAEGVEVKQLGEGYLQLTLPNK